MTFAKMTLAGLVLALWPISAGAQDFDAAKQAYDVRDYETAMAEWRPLAEQGDKEAQYWLRRPVLNRSRRGNG